MATPGNTDFVISQGDTLPVMRIPIPRNSAGELIDLTGCTVTFIGRVADDRPTTPPVRRPIESFAAETDGADDVIAVYVHLEAGDTNAVPIPSGTNFVEMQGVLEIVDGAGEVLTVPTVPYITWWIRDDIGDGV